MNLEKQHIHNYVWNRKNEYLKQLFVLLRQQSISAQNIGIHECAELLKDLMKDLGITTRLIETNGHPVVYGETIKDENSFTLLIYGHYDVQPPDPLEAWQSDPFEPTIRDERIYCRGAGDNKGQLMAQLLGLKTFLDHHDDLPINIKFVFEGEEEVGSVNLSNFVEENKELLKADLVYTADGSSHNSGSPLLLLGARGMLSFELIAKGADWDNHSGNTGNILPNPVWKLVDLLQTMRDKNGKVLIKGFYDNVLQMSEKDKELLKKLPFDAKDIGEKIGYKSLNMEGEDYYRKLTMEPTFNICGIQSGYAGEGTKTIIPSKATVKIDARLVVDQDPMDVFNKIRQHIHNHDPEIKVNYLGSMIPSRTQAGLDTVRCVTNAVHKAFGQEPLIQPSLAGSLPDYVWTKILKTPSIIMPYANFDQRNHSPNENIKIENFLNGITCTYHVIHALGEFSQSSTNNLNKEKSV
ncbi:M20/M25/M40 family metallo-hydrolase [Bacillus seohaeanensis]|uniref:M20/M25/M40 family metallo-hydrolase n=1 Tax=Bacillus seohaeanensis TaxID=284580 RepID=A0ABW5RUT1_9BACI